MHIRLLPPLAAALPFLACTFGPAVPPGPEPAVPAIVVRPGDDPARRASEALRATVQTEVPYLPTPQATVRAMMQMARVSRDDVLYDLGSGDGRIVVTAARDHGARGVGYEMDPRRIAEAHDNARAAGVADRVRFVQGDLFQAPLGEASVVTLYLLQSVNLRLRPKLLDELRPGTRVVSHAFTMGDWEPDERRRVGEDQLSLWIIPARVAGRWSWTAPDGSRRQADLRQEFQKLQGDVRGGGTVLELRKARVNGREVAFELAPRSARLAAVERYRGVVEGATISGTAEGGGLRKEWTARIE